MEENLSGRSIGERNSPGRLRRKGLTDSGLSSSPHRAAWMRMLQPQKQPDGAAGQTGKVLKGPLPRPGSGRARLTPRGRSRGAPLLECRPGCQVSFPVEPKIREANSRHDCSACGQPRSGTRSCSHGWLCRSPRPLKISVRPVRPIRNLATSPNPEWVTSLQVLAGNPKVQFARRIRLFVPTARSPAPSSAFRHPCQPTEFQGSHPPYGPLRFSLSRPWAVQPGASVSDAHAST